MKATGADIRHKGDKASYKLPLGGKWPNHKSGDYIQIPPMSRFTDLSEYFDTIFHELAHWSEPRIEIDRETLGYAMCELIAEITACYIATDLHLPQHEDIKNHTSYLKSWLEKMGDDPNFIFKASSQASKTADHILSFSCRGEYGSHNEEEGSEIERASA